MKKTVCITFDVEPDFGGLLTNDVYFGKKDLPKLERIVNMYNLKLTAFVTGKTLEENPEIIDLLENMKAEIAQHSYSHRITQRNDSDHDSKIKDIQKGIEVHEKIVGTRPLGYRAPLGIITQEEISFLDDIGIKYDSSVWPAFFPGRFNRLNFPVMPFAISESNLIEIPMAVIPKIRIPIALGYMQLVGIRSFKLLFAMFGLPNLVVYGFHTYQLGKVASYNELSAIPKLGYYRAQRRSTNPAQVFEDFVKYILSKGYESKYMIDIYNDVKSKVPLWEWSGD